MGFLDSTSPAINDKMPTPLYELELPIREKVERVAKEIYRAGEVVWSQEALSKAKELQISGHGNIPVCIAKTQYSFSDDPTLINAPNNHPFRVSELRLSAGAGFVVALSGSIMTMPGLPKTPSAEAVGIVGDKISVEGKWVSSDEFTKTLKKRNSEALETQRRSKEALNQINEV